MEFILNLINILYNLFFDTNDKNDFYLNKLIESLLFLFEIFKNKFIFFLLFFLIFFITIYLFLINSKKYILLVISNIFIFFIILIIFPINIPFTDSYDEINLLFNNNIINYLFHTDSGFFFFFFRILHLIVYKYYNLNYSIFTYLNFSFFILSILLFFIYLKKEKLSNYIIFFILILFNGKWINNFYESVNISWTINLFLVLFFINSLNIKNNIIKNFIISNIYLFVIFNFKAGIVVLIYSILYGFLTKEFKNKIFFIITPIIIYSFYLYIVFNYSDNPKLETHNALSSSIDLFNNQLNYFRENKLILLENFLAIQVLIFTPFIFPMKYIFILLSLMQYFFICKFFIIDKKNFFNSFKFFILNNPLILIGFLGCILISFSRTDYNQVRYMSFSLLFQLGFFIFYFRHFSQNLYSIFNKVILNFFILFYVINLFIPHQGFFIALHKHYINEVAKDCFINNTNIEKCYSKMFYLTFYDIKQEHYNNFKESIFELKSKNLTIFYNINNQLQ